MKYRKIHRHAECWRQKPGGAMQHSVLSLRLSRAHHGKVVGWIVRVRA
jgi:hypothetical protein